MSKKVAFLFPGQGSQSVGMGKDLYENFESSKNVFDFVCKWTDATFRSKFN